jgi:hypothetical protein
MVWTVRVRLIGLLWASICCPLLGWAAAWYGNQATEGRLGVSAAVALMAILPAALAATGNALPGRSAWEVARALIAAGSTCYLGFLCFVLWFLLTVAPEFFN